MSEMRVDLGGGREKIVPVNYPANSKKARQEPPEKKKVEKVITGEVTKRKRPWTARVSETMIGEGTQSVAQYVLLEVMVPAAKNMISDAVSQGIERLLFGDARPRGGKPGYTNYSSKSSPHTGNRELSRRARATHDFDDVVLSSRAEAEDVLDHLRNLVDKYDVATVADMYDLVGISGNFTDDKWGWYDLRSASVRNVRDGYLLILPKPEPITD